MEFLKIDTAKSLLFEELPIYYVHEALTTILNLVSPGFKAVGPIWQYSENVLNRKNLSFIHSRGRKTDLECIVMFMKPSI